MRKINPRNSAVLTAAEARKLEIQLSETIESSIGTFVNRKGKRIFIRPVEWIIDKHSCVELDISHTTYKVLH
jgi:hypothetical protein